MFSKFIIISLLITGWVTTTYARCYTAILEINSNKISQAATGTVSTVTIEAIKNPERLQPGDISQQQFSGNAKLPKLTFCNEYDREHNTSTTAKITLAIRLKQGDTQPVIAKGSCTIAFKETHHGSGRHPYLTGSYGTKITAKGDGILKGCRITSQNDKAKTFSVGI